MDPKRRFKNREVITSPSIRVVGAPRSEHGTRLCQRIVCGKCKKVDYIPLRVTQASDPFCRDCAEKILFAYDQGRQIQTKQVACSCEQCFTEFSMAENIAKKKERILCPDCYRGFEVWRGKAEAKTADRKRPILTKIGSHATIRKVIDDAI